MDFHDQIGARSVVAFVTAVLIVVLATYLRVDFVWLPVALASAVMLGPVVEWLARVHLDGGRPLAIAILATVSVIVAGLVTISVPAVNAAQGLARAAWSRVQNTGSLVEFFRPEVRTPWGMSGSEPAMAFTPSASVSAGSSMAATTITAGFALALIVLLLVEGPRWTRAFWHSLDPKTRSTMQPCAQRVRTCILCSVWVSLAVASVAGLMLGFALVLLEAPHLVPLGIIAGYFDLTPILAAGLMIGIALFGVWFVSIQAAFAHELVTEIGRLRPNPAASTNARVEHVQKPAI